MLSIVDSSTSTVLRTSSGQSGLSHRERSDDHQITSHNLPFGPNHQQRKYDYKSLTSPMAETQLSEQMARLGDDQGCPGIEHNDTDHVHHFNTGASHQQLAYSTDSEKTLSQIQVNNTSGRRYYQGLKSKQIRELRRMCRKTANRSQYEKRTVQLRQVSTIECLAVSAIPFLATVDSALRSWMKKHRDSGAEWTDEFPLDKDSQCELRQWDQMLHNLVARITTMNNNCRTARDSQQRTKNTRYMAVGVVPGSTKCLHSGNKSTTGTHSRCDPNAEDYSVVCVEDDSDVNASRTTGPATYSLDVSGPPPFSYHIDETKYQHTTGKQNFEPDVQSPSGGVHGGADVSSGTQVLSSQLNNKLYVRNMAQSNRNSSGPEICPIWSNLNSYSHQHSSASQTELPVKFCDSVRSKPPLGDGVLDLRTGPDPGSTSGSSSASNTGSWSIVSADSVSSLEKERKLVRGQIAGFTIPTFVEPSAYLPSTESIEDVRIPLSRSHLGISNRPRYSSVGCHYDEIGSTGKFDARSIDCLQSVRTPGVDITNMKNISTNNNVPTLENRPSLTEDSSGSSTGLNYMSDGKMNVEKSMKVASMVDFVEEAKTAKTPQEKVEHVGKVKSRFPLAPRTPVSIPISFEPNPFDPSNAHDQEEVQARPDLTDTSTYHLFGPSFMEMRRY